MDQDMRIKLENMKGMLKIHGADGNWNYDEYSFGVYNGMEFMVALMENRSPKFREKPEVWLKDLEK